MIVKILGAIDLAAAGALLFMTFGLPVFVNYLLFCAGLLFVKGLFVLTGDFLSVVDVVVSLILLSALVITLPVAFYWVSALLLLAKGVASFL